MTEQGLQRLIEYLQSVFREEMSLQAVDAYRLTLEPDDDGVILKNAVAYCRSERARYGLPKPGDLLDHEDLESLSLRAWQKAQDICLDLWGSWDLDDDPALAVAIDRLGGRERLHEEIRNASDFEFRQIQKDFERTYRSARLNREKGPTQLVGAMEAHNQAFPDHPYVKRMNEGRQKNRLLDESQIMKQLEEASRSKE